MKKFSFNLQQFAAISNSNSNTIITAIDAYDSVTNYGSNVQIYLGDGDDTINNAGDYVTMSGGEGNNIITNYGDNTSVLSGSGNDYIYNRYANNAIITSNSGNDTVWHMYASNVAISTGDGDDSVVVSTPDYSSNALDGPSRYLSVNLGSGNDTYTDYTDSYWYPDYNTVVSESGNNYIHLDGSYGAAYTGNGNDTLSTVGDGVLLSGGEGNNSISSSGDNVTITAGSGNDTIRAYSDNSVITAGAGDDKISLGSSNSGNIINYTYGEGNDTIINFSSSDTLYITTPTGYSTMKSGNNMYLDFGNQTIALQDVGLTVGTLNFVVNYTDNNSSGGGTNYSGNTYTGGNMTIANFSSEETINYQTDFKGFSFNDTDFMVHSSSGTLDIQNARDKLINFATNGNTIAVAYLASGGGEINGEGFSVPTIIIGGNDSENILRAGSAGSSLWGGSGGADTLIGGAGQDNFFFGKYSGIDVISNASSNDVVNLFDVSLSDIVSANTEGNVASLNLNTGGTLHIISNENLSPTIQLSDSSWKYNQSSGQWQNA